MARRKENDMILRTLVLFGALIGGANAQANPAFPFSVFVGLNQSDADTAVIGFTEAGLPPPTLGDSFSGTGFRLGAAWSFSRNMSMEVGWSRFGTRDDRTNHFLSGSCPFGPCVPPQVPAIVDTVEQSGGALWAAFVPSIERGPILWFGKLGVASAHVESEQSGDPSNRLKETDTVALVGVGASYSLSDRFRIRAEFERVGSVANQFGLGVEFGF
jgi:opacity protein-like surface antigen